MSTAGFCMAASTASGMTVGPGMERNSRPAETGIKDLNVLRSFARKREPSSRVALGPAFARMRVRALLVRLPTRQINKFDRRPMVLKRQPYGGLRRSRSGNRRDMLHVR